MFSPPGYLWRLLKVAHAVFFHYSLFKLAHTSAFKYLRAKIYCISCNCLWFGQSYQNYDKYCRFINSLPLSVAQPEIEDSFHKPAEKRCVTFSFPVIFQDQSLTGLCSASNEDTAQWQETDTHLVLCLQKHCGSIYWKNVILSSFSVTPASLLYFFMHQQLKCEALFTVVS